MKYRRFRSRLAQFDKTTVIIAVASILIGSSLVGLSLAAAAPPSLDSDDASPPPLTKRYVDNRDGTVTDRNTALMWEQKCVDCDDLHSIDRKYYWSGDGQVETIWDWLDQLNAQGGEGFGGYSDWRIPNIKELLSIVDYSRFNPAVHETLRAPQQSDRCQQGALADGSCLTTDLYWTSTTFSDFTAHALLVDTRYGFVDDRIKTSPLQVRAVRSVRLSRNAEPADAGSGTKDSAKEMASKPEEEPRLETNPSVRESKPSPLHLAASAGDVGGIRELLAQGVELEARDPDGLTPLLTSIIAQETEATADLIEGGADISTAVSVAPVILARLGFEPGDGRTVEVTPLFVAAAVGNRGDVTELLDHRADVDAGSPEFGPPLVAASKLGHDPAVELLLKAGADPNRHSDTGPTALVAAIERENDGIVDQLIASGADLNLVGGEGRGPLIAAISRGDRALVSKLVEAGADLESPSFGGITPLLAAVFQEKRELVQDLIKLGANVDARDEFGYTATTAAVQRSDRDLLRLLAAAGADLNRPDRRGVTPLRTAIELPDTELAALLVELGAETIDPETDGKAPVHASIDITGLLGQWAARTPNGALPAVPEDVDLPARVMGLSLDADANKIYWSDFEGHEIRRANRDGTANERVLSASGPIGVAFDADLGSVFYTTDHSYPREVSRRLSGAAASERLHWGRSVNRPNMILVAGSPSRLYWSETVAGRIRSAKPDGTDLKDLLISGLGETDEPGAEVTAVQGIAIDESRQKLYWTDLATGAIRKANLDGSREEMVLGRDDGLESPVGIALSPAGAALFWTDQVKGTISRAGLDGSDIQEIVTPSDDRVRPRAITFDSRDGKLYWSDAATGAIQRVPIDGAHVVETVVSPTAHLDDDACDARRKAATRHLRALVAGPFETCLEIVAAIEAVKSDEADLAPAAASCTQTLSRVASISDEAFATAHTRILGPQCAPQEASSAGATLRSQGKESAFIAVMRRYPRAGLMLRELRPWIVAAEDGDAQLAGTTRRAALAVLDDFQDAFPNRHDAPAKGASRVSATGQSTSYRATRLGAGTAQIVPDDGAERAGVPMRFIDEGDGTITDPHTGLMWEKKCDCEGELHDFRNGYAWTGDADSEPPSIGAWLDSINREDENGFAGYNDWRLPTVHELTTILDYERFNPSVDPTFNASLCGMGCTDLGDADCSCTEINEYWSSDSYTPDPNSMLAVGFNLGLVGDRPRDGALPARAVRTVMPTPQN